MVISSIKIDKIIIIIINNILLSIEKIVAT